MRPIYKFELTIGATTQRCYPIYKDDLAKDFEMESNQQFFRAKLSGKLTFESVDYDRIVSAAFDTQFLLEIFISYNAGQSWTSYWSGAFWKTDCDFDGDAKTVKVTPTVSDQYNDVLAGMEKEYNLIELLPEMVPITLDKRPMIQVYVPGQSVIGCFLSGMWWEQECEPVQETDVITIDEQDYPALEYKYHFALNTRQRIIDISGANTPQIPDVFIGAYPGNYAVNYQFTNSGYKFAYHYSQPEPGWSRYVWQIIRVSDDVVLWQYVFDTQGLPPQYPLEITLTPITGTGASGNVKAYIHDVSVYARYVLDVDTILGLNTYPLPDDDLVGNNRNYHRAIGYAVSDVIYFSTRLVETPTQWGIYQPGQYYQQPYLYWFPELFPIARNGWGRVSIWFSFSAMDWLLEESGRAQYTLKDAFPLSSVISVLLGEIAPGLTHDATTDYSQFLYGNNPISNITQVLAITPKSNIISAGYDQPAQKAPITLKYVMDMLRDCFRCYWFVDAQGRFRIEHIRYFMLGGTYSGTPVVGTDLTTEKVTRNGKNWSFARNQYQFDKPDMAARYQFGWMDDVTQLFEGFPIDIDTKFVTPGKIEEISISQFTSDVDYILLNPGEISKDGFVLFGCKPLRKTSTQSTTAGELYRNVINVDFKKGSRVRVYFYAPGVFSSNAANIAVNYSNVAGCNSGQWTEFVLQTDATTIDINRSGTGVLLSQSVTLIIETVSYLNLPYVNFSDDGTDHILQNGYVSFAFLQRYYAYDMPAWQYKINGVQQYAYGIKKLKTQTLKYPLLNDPDLVKLVKTNIGNGMIQKLSVNLSSRNANATLKYDTE